MLRILYGGTFDPIHNGHLTVARTARDMLAADVYFLPAADPPHRQQPGASAELRAQMLALAIADEAHFHLDRRELLRAGPSYTVDTLREIRAQLGATVPLVWLIGADAFCAIDSWRHWRDLFDLSHFAVAVRPGFTLTNASDSVQSVCAGRWQANPGMLATAAAGLLWALPSPPQPASATTIRKRLASGEEVSDWLPDAVANFIRVQGLYRASV